MIYLGVLVLGNPPCRWHRFVIDWGFVWKPGLVVATPSCSRWVTFRWFWHTPPPCRWHICSVNNKGGGLKRDWPLSGGRSAIFRNFRNFPQFPQFSVISAIFRNFFAISAIFRNFRNFRNFPEFPQFSAIFWGSPTVIPPPCLYLVNLPFEDPPLMNWPIKQRYSKMHSGVNRPKQSAGHRRRHCCRGATFFRGVGG